MQKSWQASAIVLMQLLVPPSTLAVQVRFNDPPQGVLASHSQGGVLVTSSGMLDIAGGTVGVYGGVGNNGVDPAGLAPDEWLQFTAEGDGPFASFKFVSGGMSNFSGFLDEYTLEGFDDAGVRVGMFDYHNSGVDRHNILFFDDFVARIGVGPLKSIRVTASGDEYELQIIDVTFVPEPHLAGLLSVGLIFSSRRFSNRR